MEYISFGPKLAVSLEEIELDQHPRRSGQHSALIVFKLSQHKVSSSGTEEVPLLGMAVPVSRSRGDVMNDLVQAAAEELAKRLAKIAAAIDKDPSAESWLVPD